MDITKLNDIHSGEIILLELDIEKYSIDYCQSVFNYFKTIFSNNPIIALPKGILTNITIINDPILNNNDNDYPFISI